MVNKFRIFKCSKTVERKKSGRKVRCNRFICEISDKIVLVCGKCGTKYSLTQEEDGRFTLAVLVESIFKIRLNKEK